MASEADIAKFTDFTNASRDEALRFIQGTGGHVEEAVSQYFENPGKYQNQATYDESAWGQDRFGEYQQADTIPSFQIDAPDEVGPAQGSYQRSAAPTRPPSRASHRSATPSSMHMNDATSSGRNSAMDWHTQETGLIGGTSSGTCFGPATRAEYDSSQWALTTVPGTSAQEYIPDVPSAADRGREEGKPAMLKPLPMQDEYLPNLITIFSQIPLAREALLAKSAVIKDYGYDQNWWCGTAITFPKTVHVDENGAANQEEPPDLYITHETQRLMAFLQDTERAYGSVGALHGLLEALPKPPSDIFTNWDSYTHRFLRAFTDNYKAYANSDDTVFTSTISTYEQGQKTDDTQFRNLEISLDEPAELVGTLYDALDGVIWTGNPDGTEEREVLAISQFASVFTIRLKREKSGIGHGLDLDIPAEWYADRYDAANLDEAKKMRQSMAKYRAELARLDRLYNKYAYAPVVGENRKIDAIEMFKSLAKSMKSYGTPLANPEEAVTARQRNPPDTSKEVKQMEELVVKIEAKLKDLTEKITKAKEELKNASNLLKEPGEDKSTGPKLKYRLRGACTDNNTTYVLDATSSWQKLQYTNSAVISTSTVSEAAVIRAAEQDSKTVLLVYAADHGLQPLVADDTLPESLRQFVETDNLAFRGEVETEEPFRSRGADDDDCDGAAEAPQVRRRPSRWDQEPAGQGWEAGDVDLTWDAQGGSRGRSPPADRRLSRDDSVMEFEGNGGILPAPSKGGNGKAVSGQAVGEQAAVGNAESMTADIVGSTEHREFVDEESDVEMKDRSSQ